MRELRVLAADVWYNVSTAVNNGEPLFRTPQDWQVHLFHQVLIETREIFVFELRGLKLEGDTASFYIKPADGFQLPEIMQWLKQTFAVRFNVIDGRTGHIWGDRYWSLILPGEPPEDAEAHEFAPVVCGAKRKAWSRCAAVSDWGCAETGNTTAATQAKRRGRPRLGRRSVITRLRLNLPRRTASLPA
jgi:hypothetical protein